ncbi:ribonuclease HI [Hazenella sp. IB182357]|uniref:Ribonuclease H n=1 Tax=Polycladospora coralii TaxID=2771432 RepID=A0A926RTN9_9BACL|nr:ribonuclease HI [Polycladospora coralii]MBD1373050.1 ribonuclease HI [Polycladospora coralii]MBS7529605.1 ribonuclease HI [Polycladospora coralii]
MKEIIVYTDGACSHNPGPGGWAAVLMYGEKKKELSGGESETTNNRMELQAVIESLRALKTPCKVKLHSDSAYIVNCINQRWYAKWQKNGWQTSQKKPVENKDLWQQLLRLTSKHDVTFIKVKGHSDVELNNRCDELARAAVPRG